MKKENILLGMAIALSIASIAHNGYMLNQLAKTTFEVFLSVLQMAIYYGTAIIILYYPPKSKIANFMGATIHFLLFACSMVMCGHGAFDGGPEVSMHIVHIVVSALQELTLIFLFLVLRDYIK